MMLTCATLVASLLAASPGETLVLAAGQDCGPVTVRNRQWSSPVTLVASGARLRDLVLHDVAGFVLVGGTVEASAGMNGRGTAAYAAHVRGTLSADIRFSGVTFTNAVRGLVLASETTRVTVEASRFIGLRSEGINITGTYATVIGSAFRDFVPVPSKCAVGGAQLGPMARRDCVAKGGVWTDGDHPDAVQMFGPAVVGHLIAGNRIEGDMQSIGIFNGAWPKAETRGVRVIGNYVRSPRSWGIAIQNCTDCEVVGNDVGRTEGGLAKVQINVTGSTGLFCGNTNPDARATDLTAKPCPDAPKGVVGRNSD